MNRLKINPIKYKENFQNDSELFSNVKMMQKVNLIDLE